MGRTCCLQFKKLLELPLKGFNFISVFKWEKRKNWEALLEAFCTEFHRKKVHRREPAAPFAPHSSVFLSSRVSPFWLFGDVLLLKRL